MTDKLRDAAQLALEALNQVDNCTYINDYGDAALSTTYESGMVDKAITAIRAALTEQQDAQAVPSPTAGMNIAQRILHVGGRNNAAGYVEFGSIQAVEALVRQVVRDLPELAELENLRHNVKVYREATALALNAAPTPPAPKPLGWLDRKAVECLQGAELNWMPAWNRPTSADPVPVFLGSPTRATLTARELLNMMPESIPAEHDNALLEYARAVIEAYERKNGIK